MHASHLVHLKYSFHFKMLESVNRRSQHEKSVWEFVETTVHQSVLNYQTETANRLRGSREKLSAKEVADMLVAAVQGENVTKVHMYMYLRCTTILQSIWNPVQL